ncbi:hypothetical protein ES044_15795 [Polaribacter sp. IC066]|nr:hypothetical protein ES043_01665 [Polaribacter sp. IC063]TXD57125.1 hypothetical protein ES044_15795 [Polaribacter sp. IC066]
MKIPKDVHKYFLALTYVIGCFPILTFGMRSVITILWCLLGLLIFSKNRIARKLNKDIWIFVLPYLLLLFSLTYSENLQSGIDSLIKMISFIIFPLIFYFNRDFFSKKQISRIIYVFVLSVFLIIIYQVIHVVLNYTFITDNITFQEIKANGFSTLTEISEEKVSQIKLRRFRNFIIKISNTHTTYQGLWISFAVFFLGSEFKKIKKNSLKIVNLFLIIVLIIWLYFISARMPLLALLISSSLTILFFSNFSNLKLAKLGLIFSVVVVATLCFKNPFSIRVKEYYNTGLTLLEKSSKASEFNSSNVRNGIYYCDLKLVRENSIIGFGIGDIQDKLNSCYKSNLESEIYNWHTYNTHNQYFFFWISSGIFGVLALLILIFTILQKSYKEKNKLLFFLLCLVSIVFLTESLLERSDGLIFFSFFMGLLFFNKKRDILT